MSDPSIVDVAIVGAGISGLAAAYELQKQALSVLVLDKSNRAGGVIQTDRLGEFVIDAGPDSLLVQKPAAVALCREIGIGERLIGTLPPRTAYVLRRGVLHSLPGASVLGFPTRIRPTLRSTLFTLGAKARMGIELFLPRRKAEGDESIASFVRRRFGTEAVQYIADPLLGGIHGGDVERLSMRALFPRFVDAERQSRSIILSFRKMQGPPNAGGAFRSFPGGLDELIDGLLRAIPDHVVRLNTAVSRIEPSARGFILHVDGAEPLHARALMLACPAFAAGCLLQPLDARLSSLCGSIKYLSTATVVLAFPRDAVDHPLRGTGFVVPRTEGLNITAGAWISSKWPHRAPEGHALMRAFMGGARDPDVLSKTDGELVEIAVRELGGILGLRGAPEWSRVYRWDRSSPQLEVGHIDLMAAIDAQLVRHPGIFVSASGFRGVGIPDCVADARAEALKAAAFVNDQRHQRSTEDS
jgi:protoporphyrinogen/coproporphyrinogen III oxidase